MKAYRDELAAGVREARDRIAAGSLSLALPKVVRSRRGWGDDDEGEGGDKLDGARLSAVAIKSAEQEYALRKRLAHAQRRVDDLEDIANGVDSDGVDDDDDLNDGSASDASLASLDTEDNTKSEDKSVSRKRSRLSDKRFIASAISEIQFQSTRAFLLTLQHDGVSGGGGRFRQEDSASSQQPESRLPLPIPVGEESIAALEALLMQLGHLSGLSLLSVDQTRLPSLYQTVWKLRGQPCSNFKLIGTSVKDEDEDATVNASLAFTAQFKVDEKSSKISELKLDCSQAAWLEIGSVVLHCEAIGCLRSFCASYSQYCELYVARERLFARLEDEWPGKVKVVAAEEVKALPFDILSRVLEVQGFDGEMMWLIWEPYFRIQSTNEEKGAQQVVDDDGQDKTKRPLDDVFANVREGYSLRTRLELWRRKLQGECVHNRDFATLVKARGLDSALHDVIKALF